MIIKEVFDKNSNFYIFIKPIKLTTLNLICMYIYKLASPDENFTNKIIYNQRGSISWRKNKEFTETNLVARYGRKKSDRR